MMHNVFKDKLLNDAFERDGYVVLDFIDAQTVQKLLAGYSSSDDVMGAASFSSSLLRHDDNNYRKRVSQSICDAFKSRTDNLLDNHKWILGNYLIKYKSPEVGYDGEVPLHQDASLTDESKYYSINIWCPLVDTNSQNGTLQVVNGSHHLNSWPRGYGQGFNEKFPYAEHEDFIRDNYLIPISLKAGQAIVCTTKLFHASQPNHTNNPRIVCSGVLVPSESPLRTYYYDRQIYKDLEAFEVPEDYYLNNPIFDRPDEKLYKKIAVLPIQYDQVDREGLKKILSKPYLHLGLEKPIKEQRKKLKISLPKIENEWQQLAVDGLIFLLKQYGAGLHDVQHKMHFPTSQGFSSGLEDQIGDIFQRALLADTLCDFSLWMEDQLLPIIKGEIDYLISQQRNDEVGGWSYFPDLPELPADADDLAQVMQLLVRANQREDLTQHCEKPLKVLLDDQGNDDGSFESWIIPKNNLSELQKIQSQWAIKAWGTGADAEVLANLYYSLFMYDPERFAPVIERGMQFLLKQMQPEGYWKSTWYCGNYYGTYVALRALTTTKTPFLTNTVYQYLVQTQHKNGGWGIDGTSTPLQTAFALLGLYYIYQGEQKIDDQLLEKGLNYLTETKESYSWSESSFIKMELGRAQGFTNYVLEYGSETITTNFVAKASLYISALLNGQQIK